MSLEGWKSLFEIGGVTLLFLTFVFGAGALYCSNRINAAQDARLRQFDLDLTGAKTALSLQQERAANADAKVAGLEQDAANAKIEMAKQQTRAAEAEKALLELQERMKDRHLSIEQQRNIIAKLRQFAGMRLNLFAFSNGGDEVKNFSNELIGVLGGPSGARWAVSASLADEPGLVVPGIGIEMQRNADERSIEAANALLKALASERLSVGLIPALPPGESRMKAGALNEDPKAMIRIIIGKKP
jgi:hypothetical protein